MVDKTLEGELMRKYATANSEPAPIKSTVKGREAIEAMLLGKECLQSTDAKDSSETPKVKYASVTHVAREKGVSKSTVYKRAREMGVDMAGSGLVPEWVVAHIKTHRSGPQAKLQLDDEKIAILKQIYGKGFKRRRNKPEKETVQYWAKQWGVSRTALARYAKSLNLAPDDYRREWGEGETSMLRRLAQTCGSAKELQEKMRSAGFERSAASLSSKLHTIRVETKESVA